MGNTVKTWQNVISRPSSQLGRKAAIKTPLVAVTRYRTENKITLCQLSELSTVTGPGRRSQPLAGDLHKLSETC